MKDGETGLFEALNLVTKVKALANNMSKISQDELKGKKCGAVSRKIMLVEAQQLEETVRKISVDAQLRASQAGIGTESRAALVKAAAQAKRLEEIVKRLNSDATMLAASAPPPILYQETKGYAYSSINDKQPSEKLSNSFSVRRNYPVRSDTLRHPQNRRGDATNRVDEFTKAFQEERRKQSHAEEANLDNKQNFRDDNDGNVFLPPNGIDVNTTSQATVGNAQAHPETDSATILSKITSQIQRSNAEILSKRDNRTNPSNGNNYSDSDAFEENRSSITPLDKSKNKKEEEFISSRNDKSFGHRGRDQDETSLKSTKSKSSRRTNKSSKSDKTRDSETIMMESVTDTYLDANTKYKLDMLQMRNFANQIDSSSISTRDSGINNLDVSKRFSKSETMTTAGTDNASLCSNRVSVSSNRLAGTKDREKISMNDLVNKDRHNGVGRDGKSISSKESPKKSTKGLGNSSMVSEHTASETQRSRNSSSSHNGKQSRDDVKNPSETHSHGTSQSKSRRNKLWEAIRARIQTVKESSDQITRKEDDEDVVGPLTQRGHPEAADDTKSYSSRRSIKGAIISTTDGKEEIKEEESNEDDMEELDMLGSSSYEDMASLPTHSFSHGSIQEAVSGISDDTTVKAVNSNVSDTASYSELVKYMSFQDNLERGFEVLLHDSVQFRKKYFPVIREEDNESGSDDDDNDEPETREDNSSSPYRNSYVPDDRIDEIKVIGPGISQSSYGERSASSSRQQRKEPNESVQSEPPTKYMTMLRTQKTLADDDSESLKSLKSLKSKKSAKSNKSSSGWYSLPPKNVRVKKGTSV